MYNKYENQPRIAIVLSLSFRGGPHCTVRRVTWHRPRTGNSSILAISGLVVRPPTFRGQIAAGGRVASDDGSTRRVAAVRDVVVVVRILQSEVLPPSRVTVVDRLVIVLWTSRRTSLSLRWRCRRCFVKYTQPSCTRANKQHAKYLQN